MRWVIWAATPMHPEDRLNRPWRERGSKWATLCRRCESGVNGSDWEPHRPASHSFVFFIFRPFGSPLLAPGPSILLQSVCAMYIDKSVAMSALPSLAFINTRSSRVVSFYATLQQVWASLFLLQLSMSVCSTFPFLLDVWCWWFILPLFVFKTN